jgi:DNA-binding HxlR family transcriptional regulator
LGCKTGDATLEVVVQRKSFDNMPCGIARSAEVVGDAWTLVILREALFGVTTFDDFQAKLDIPRSTLSGRLQRLVDLGVFRVEPNEGDGRSKAYVLQERGRDLWKVLLALQQWGNRWLADASGPPSYTADRATGTPLADLEPVTAAGKRVDLDDVMMVAGPSAPPWLRRRLESLVDGDSPEDR